MHFDLFYGYQKATTAWSCVCVKHYLFTFKSAHFGWRENVSDLECTCHNEIYLPPSLLKISATETLVTPCRTQAAIVEHSSHQSLNLFTELFFFFPLQYIFYEKQRLVTLWRLLTEKLLHFYFKTVSG